MAIKRPFRFLPYPVWASALRGKKQSIEVNKKSIEKNLTLLTVTWRRMTTF